MADRQIEKSKIKMWTFETGKSVKWIERDSGVNYTTLENLVFSRPLMYHHRTLRDVAKSLKWTIPELLDDIVKAEYTSKADIATVIKLCERYGIQTDYKLPVAKKTTKANNDNVASEQ